MKFRGIDSPGDLGQVDRVDLRQPFAPAIELGFEPEHRLQHFGVGFGRAANQETLFSGAEALMAIPAVEAEADDRGLEPARCSAGLRRHRHLEEGLSRVVIRREGEAEARVLFPDRPPANAILIGFPYAIE